MKEWNKNMLIITPKHVKFKPYGLQASRFFFLCLAFILRRVNTTMCWIGEDVEAESPSTP